MTRLVAFAVFLQALEMLAICRGPLALALLGASVAAFIYPHPAPLAFMLVATWGFAWLYRGTFNGGSDSMTVFLLLACLLDTPEFAAGVLVLTYFVAGVAKLVSGEWRSGRALRDIVERSPYAYVKRLPVGWRTAAWAVILFECAWPLALLAPWPFVIAGVVFHALNVYYFGLNRFFWIWIAAYPALLTSAGRV